MSRVTFAIMLKNKAYHYHYYYATQMRNGRDMS